MSNAGSSWFEIPVTSPPQTMQATLGGTVYTLTFLWRDDPGGNGCWTLDIFDATGTDAIQQGVPLVTGADLLAQYEYLGLGGQLVVGLDGNQTGNLTFESLGDTAHLYWIPDQ